MRKLVELLLTFMKIGMFTFGGGYAMLSVIEDECVERKQWITRDEMMKITVIAESTPGPIAINCATYIGYQRAGVPGAIFATLGVVIPSFGVIYIISTFLDDFLEYEIVAKAFKGIKIAVGLMIFNVGRNMMRKVSFEILSRIIWSSAFILMLLIDIFSWKFSSISLILIAAVIGVSASFVHKLSEKKARNKRK
ncbi:MAG: chromate transporter [bacterium]|nr:chromate transporter [bacterium]